jgi:transcriptional regulator GlxA family with amidase domain
MLTPEAISSVKKAEAERHYTVTEIAELWRVSTDTVRRLFEDEPGVIVIFKFKPGTRPYRTLRIPQSVVDRVRNK